MSIGTVGHDPEKSAIAVYDEVDRSFLAWFEEYPEINKFANDRATDVYSMWHAFLAEIDPLTVLDPEGDLHFQLKKVVVLFTDHDFPANTLDSYEYAQLLTLARNSAKHRGISIPAALSEFSKLADTSFLKTFSEGPILDWNNMVQRDKFLLTVGAFLVTEANALEPEVPAQIPAQQQRTDTD